MGETPAPTSDPNAAADDSWPMLGRDLRSSFRTGSTDITRNNVAMLTETWTLTENVYGTPAVVDDRVYVVALGGTYALDVATGNVVWHNADVGGTSSPAVDRGVVYVYDGGAILHALDAVTGDEIWQEETDPNQYAAGYSSPVVANDRVIVGVSSTEEYVADYSPTFRGSLVAFDRETGAEVWRHDTVDPPFNGVAMWSTATVDLESGHVFGSTGNNYTGEASETSDSIFALDLDTGGLVWNRQLAEGDVYTIQRPRSEDSDFGTNPLLFEATIDGTERKLVGAGQKSGMFWVLDRETGEVVWSKQVSGGSEIIGGVFNNGAFDGERIIVAGNDGTSAGPGSEPANGESEVFLSANTPTSVLMALDPAHGAVIWERQLPAWVWAPITISGEVGFVSAESTLQAFDVTTGEKLFELDTDGTIASGAAVAGTRIFFGSGLVYVGTTPGQTFRALALP